MNLPVPLPHEPTIKQATLLQLAVELHLRFVGAVADQSMDQEHGVAARELAAKLIEHVIISGAKA